MNPIHHHHHHHQKSMTSKCTVEILVNEKTSLQYRLWPLEKQSSSYLTSIIQAQERKSGLHMGTWLAVPVSGGLLTFLHAGTSLLQSPSVCRRHHRLRITAVRRRGFSSSRRPIISKMSRSLSDFTLNFRFGDLIA